MQSEVHERKKVIFLNDCQNNNWILFWYIFFMPWKITIF